MSRSNCLMFSFRVMLVVASGMHATQASPAKKSASNTVVKRQDASSLQICYFCDLNCERSISDTEDDAAIDAYFDEITNHVEENLQGTLDENFVVNNYLVIKPHAPIELSWYANGTNSLAVVSKTFWENNDFFDDAQTYGCDVGFLAASSDDAFLQSIGQSGVANMYSICTDTSYGVIQVGFAVNGLTSHELGHLLGMEHNDDLDEEKYNWLEDTYPDLYTRLTTDCPDPDCGEDCIMNEVVSGSAATYGPCAQAYFDLLKVLSEDYPTYYEADMCVPVEERRRQLLNAARRESDSEAPLLDFNEVITKRGSGADEDIIPPELDPKKIIDQTSVSDDV